MLFRAQQIKSLLEKARLRHGHESLRPRRRHAHREALGDEGVADRIGAHERWPRCPRAARARGPRRRKRQAPRSRKAASTRSEEHTSELQSRLHLVCRLLLEKKKK